MLMDVMHIRHMGMCVSQPDVLVKMSVGLAMWVHGVVRMPMVFVVHVRMCVGHRLVNMLVLMTLGQVQPNPYCHEDTGNGELRSNRLAKSDDRRDTSEKGRG